ncbi:MAG: SDR family oxidoreductase [Vicinamibacteria bacterium]|nr:SDR family oxidoreductase [Vicinamibacteria bacterium]
MIKDLRGRGALVTGAAKRLGREIALALARAGANVAIHYGRSEEDARTVVREAEACGVHAWAVRADLSVEEEVRDLVDEAYRLAGPLDILVNSASTFHASDFATFTRADLATSIDVNAWAPLVAARRFVELGGQGHIVNLLDTRVAGFDWRHVAYHAAKTLFALFTRQMALRFAPGVQVNGVAPGSILSPSGQGAEHLERLGRESPLSRVGEPRDVSDAVLFLVATRYVTGQVVFVDGGRHLLEMNHG